MGSARIEEDGNRDDSVIEANQLDERNRLSPKGFGRRGASSASSGLVEDIPYRLARPFSHPTSRRSERGPREFFNNVLAAMDRRTFMMSAAGAGLAQARGKHLRAAVIGDTGRGNYGHGIDTVWRAFEQVEIVAVADPDPEGRARAQRRLGAPSGYADYREMLASEKPDLVGICPRYMDQRVEMITAAADAGCHIYSEKPFAHTLEDADVMVEAVRRNGVKLQLAHQMRRSPFTLAVGRMIEDGEIGEIQEVRGRGKEDHRAGGEDLMVLGSHICDMMRFVLGDPRWVFAHVTDGGSEIDGSHVRRPTEPIGPIAGREIAAMFAFDGARHGYFGSKASGDTDILRFGTHVFGSKGVLFLPNAIYPIGAQAYILRSPTWVPDERRRWEPIEVEHDRRFGDGRYLTANARMVEDLLTAIEQDRKPACSEIEGRWTTEMITGIYRSQLEAAPVKLPQRRRAHPLERL